MSGDPPVVTVLGMHRSGTSALSGALAAMGLGVGRPDSLLEANDGNPRGYFERRDVMVANEALLVARLRDQRDDLFREEVFDSPDTLDALGWLLGAWLPLDAAPAPAEHVAKLRRCMQVLRAEAGDDAPACLLKDPRLCLLLPAWRSLGGRWLAVLSLRGPAEVCRSLVRRDGMQPTTAMELWRVYMTTALYHSRALPRIAVDYDHLLDRPDKTLGEVAHFLQRNGVELPGDAVSRGMSALDTALRRSTNHEDGEVGGAADALYQRLRQAAPDVPDIGGVPAVPAAEELQRALRLPLLRRCRRQQARIEELSRSRVQLHRLLAHPVTGPLIRVLQRLKQDPTFGAP